MKHLFKFWILMLTVAATVPRVAPAEGFGVPDPRGSGNYQLRSMVWSPDSTGYSNYNRYITVGRVWSGTQFLGMIGANKSGDDSLGAGYEYFGGGHDTNFALNGGFGLGTLNANSSNGRVRQHYPYGIKLFDFPFANTSGAGYDNLCTSVIEVDTTNHYYVAGCRGMRDNTFYNVYLVKFDEYGNLVTGWGTTGMVDTGIGAGASHGFLRGMVMDSTTAFTVIGSSGTYSGNNMQPVVKRYNVSTGANIAMSGGTSPNCDDANGWEALGTNVTPTAIFWDGTSYSAPVVDWKPSGTGRRRSWHHVYEPDLDEKCDATAGTTHPFFSGLSAYTGTWAEYNDTVLVGGDLAFEMGTAVNYYAGAARINDGTTASAYSCLVTYTNYDGEPSGGFGKFLLTTTSSTSGDGLGATMFNPQNVNGRPTRDCILNDIKVRESATAEDYRQYVAGAVYNGANYDFLVGVVGDQGNTIRSLSYAMEGPENDVANRVQFFSTAGTTTTHENFYVLGRSGGSLASTSTQFAQAHTLKVENKESWVATSNTSAPTARQNHSAVWTGSKMLVWGGNVANGAIYDPVADTWATMETGSQPTPARTGSSVVWHDTTSSMIVWGGFDGTNYLQEGYKLAISSTDTNGAWTSVGTGTGQPSGRTEHATAVVNGTDGKTHMVIWGGKTAASTYTNSGADYNIDTDTWTALPGTGMLARSLAGGTGYYGTSGPAVMFWGGWNGSTYYADGAPYLLSGSWGSTTTAGTAAYGAQLTYDRNRRILRYGGYNGSYLSGFYMDVISSLGTWTAMNATGSPGARIDQVQLFNGSKLFVWGGFNGSVQAAGATYDPFADTWTAITTTGGSSARRQASAVWSGERMVVWGGNDGSSTVSTGGQYSPSTTLYHPSRNVWTAISSSSPPTARLLHSTVWTGRHMIVFGGKNTSGTALSDGNRYDPVANSWSAVDSSELDDPTARYEHTALWTGSEMIVWGGRNGATEYGDGFRYNPAEPGSDGNWTTVTTTSAPVARFGHSAVLTYSGPNTTNLATGMVVYGGESTLCTNTPGYCDDGALYKLSSGTGQYTWLGTLTFPSLAGRRDATLWFDGRYIGVWGGRNTSYLATGGLYDVRNATTTAMSSTNAPTSPAVGTWTGKYVVFLDMIGKESTNPTECATYTDAQRTGRFDPLTNTWSSTAVSTSGIPPCRAGGSYVWTGSKLLVYGGVNSSGTAIDGGALYDPIYNVWASISTSSTAARFGASAIWNGKEAIIWGGSTTTGAAGAVNTGVKYQR